jgi:hypothetical protein
VASYFSQAVEELSRIPSDIRRDYNRFLDDPWGFTQSVLSSFPGARGAAAAVGGLKIGAALVSVRALKPVNLPAWRKVTVDMVHIIERHTPGGRLSAGRDVFRNMSEQGIERAIRDAYTYSERIGGAGDRILLQGSSGRLTIEMWFNRATRTIETAYPVGAP